MVLRMIREYEIRSLTKTDIVKTSVVWYNVIGRSDGLSALNDGNAQFSRDLKKNSR